MKHILKKLFLRPVTICVAVSLLLVFGIMAALDMPITLLPDISMPILSVTVVYPGAGASGVEEQITADLRSAGSGIGNVQEVVTYSVDNASVMVLYMEYSVDVEEKRQELQTALDALQLPDGCGEPQISDVDLNGDAAVTYAIYTDGDIEDLRDTAEQLRTLFSRIDGVRSVEISGLPDGQIRLTAQKGMETAMLAAAESLSGEDLDIPFGTIAQEGEILSLRNLSGVKSVEELCALPVVLPLDQKACDAVQGLQTLLNLYTLAPADTYETYAQSLAQLHEKLQTLTESQIALLADHAQGIEAAVLRNDTLTALVRSDAFASLLEQMTALKQSGGTAISDADLAKLLADADLSSLSLPFSVTEDTVHFLRSADLSARNDTGLILKLGDIVHVEEVSHYETHASYNGQAGALIEVYAAAGANTAYIAQQAKDTVAGNTFAYTPVLLGDTSAFINESLGNVLSSLLIGGLLAVIVIYLFIRRVRSALVISITMPLSVLSALLGLWAMGISLNMVSLGGLAVGIGMLVDNSIVVLESVTKRREAGEGLLDACVNGTCEVGPSLLASTLTNVCVFLPILFRAGLTKQIFWDLVWAVTFSISMSLIVAVFVIPGLYYLLYRRSHNADIRPRARTANAKEPWMRRLERGYSHFLSRILRHRAMVCVIALIVFLASMGLAFTAGTEFLPSVDQGELEVKLTFQQNITVEEANEQSVDFAAQIRALDPDGIAYISASVGQGGPLSTDITGVLTVQLENSRYQTDDFTNAIRDLTAPEGVRVMSVTKIDGVVAEITSQYSGMTVSVLAPAADENGMDTLREISALLKEELLKVDGVVGVSDSNTQPTREYRFAFDRFACAENGIDYATVVSLLRAGVAGYSAATVDLSGQPGTEVILSFGEDVDMAQITNLILKSDGDRTVRVGDLCEITQVQTDPVIRRCNGRLQCTLDIETYGGDTGSLSDAISDTVKYCLRSNGYGDYTMKEGGVAAALREAFNGLTVSLIAAFVLLFGVMACQFESLLKPFIVIMSIPFAFTGGFLALAVTGTSLNVVSFVGLIMLMGVIVNSAIVMIDKIDMLIAEGRTPAQAVLEGCQSRLRAILMSTSTTVLALIPLSLGMGSGGALMQPLGIVVLGGLTLGTAVTLILIPCFYCIVRRVHPAPAPSSSAH